MDDDSDASSIASSSRGVRGGKTKAKAKPTTSTGKGKKAGVAGTTKKASTSTAARTRQTKLASRFFCFFYLPLSRVRSPRAVGLTLSPTPFSLSLSFPLRSFPSPLFPAV